MRTPPEELGDFRLADIVALLVVRRNGSITAAARELRVTPSQVSKAVARLEEQLHMVLLVRSSRGITVSDAAARVVPHLEEILANWRVARRARTGPLQELTIAAPSYLNSLFVPAIAQRARQVRLRVLEMPPPLIRASFAHNLFDLTLVLGEQPWPGRWIADKVGDVRKALFAAPALERRLGPPPVTVERLRDVPFISPIHTANGAYVPVDDGCPLRFGDRLLGNEVQTLPLALDLCACTEQLVFSPAIAARRHVERGSLVEVRVEGWQVSEPLYVACSADRVLARDHLAIVGALRSALDDLAGLNGAPRPVPAVAGRQGLGAGAQEEGMVLRYS